MGRTYDSELLQQRNSLITGTPSGRRPAPGPLSRKVMYHFDTLLQHIPLLLLTQSTHKLMRIPMQPNLMPLIYDLPNLFGEGFDRVRGRKPGGFDVVLVPEF